jgi:hypothetical protein
MEIPGISCWEEGSFFTLFSGIFKGGCFLGQKPRFFYNFGTEKQGFFSR